MNHAPQALLGARSRLAARLLASGLLASGLLACDASATRPAAEHSARYSLAPPADPALALLPLGAATGEATDEQQRLFDQIEADAPGFLASQPGTLVLNEAELVYFALAQSPALATHYRDYVDQEGEDAWLRPRLAWLYERLGQPTLALEHAERARAARPNDPDAHFVYGFVRAQAGGPDGLAAARDAYDRTLALAPNYVGPGGVRASDLRTQLGR